MKSSVFFVGTDAEIAHHARPLAKRMSVRCCPPEEVLALAQPGDIAIFFSEHFDRFRQTCQELKQRQVGTLYMIDGILEWRNAWENRVDEPACPWTMRPILADKVACIGYSQARVLASWGNREKLEVVGVPRFDSMRESTRPLTKSDALNVLVMSAKCPGFTPQQIEVTLQAFRDLKEFFSTHSTVDGRRVEVVWRVADSVAQHLAIDSRMSDVTGGELELQIAASDFILTTHSTAMLEAMLMNRPVGLLNYHNSPAYVPAAWNLSNAAHIPVVIAELANPSPAKLEFQRMILNDSLYLGEPATGRMVRLIERMQIVISDQIRKGEKIVFQENLLTDGSFLQPTLDHLAVFPQYSAFSNLELLETQAQLGHSRREIVHLKNRIQQLQLELTQAHQIFDQIQKHPIAGPVVRIRQRLIDTWQQIKNGEKKPNDVKPGFNKQT